MEATNGVPASLFDLIISDSFVQMESATIKKSLLFSKTESTSKTESNIIFCMIAKVYIVYVGMSRNAYMKGSEIKKSNHPILDSSDVFCVQGD